MTLAMPCYKLTIEDAGTPFVGWHIQTADLSVQGVLSDAGPPAVPA
jgi:hypothetical protein